MLDSRQEGTRPAERSRFATARASQRGGVLVVAMAAVISVAVLAAGMLQLNSSILKRQQAALDIKRAFYVAEAGLGEAYLALTSGKSGQVGSKDSPAVFGNGLFWVEAAASEGGQVLLKSTGMYGSGNAILSLVVAPSEISIASLGAFGTQGVTVEPGVLMDGYDSTLGTYVSQLDPTVAGVTTGQGAKLTSNGDIALSGVASRAEAIRILGDAKPGPNRSVQSSGMVQVSGSTDPLSESTELPGLEVPPIRLDGAVVANDPIPTLMPSGDHGYQSILVQSGSTLIVTGPARLRTGSLWVERGGEIRFDTSAGPLDIYVEDFVEFSAGSTVQCLGQDPSGLAILTKADTSADRDLDGLPDLPVEMEATGEFFGTIYAPEAEMRIADGFELFGSIGGAALTIGQGSRVHFDRAALNGSGGATLPSVVSWRVVELKANHNGSRSRDPFATMGVDRDTLAFPSDSHDVDGTVIRIRYHNTGGTQVGYTGLESSFDWNDVDTVIGITRTGGTDSLPSYSDSTSRTGILEVDLGF